MSINKYTVVLSPGGNKNGWFASVYRVDMDYQDLIILVGSQKCDDYLAASETAWKIMQDDRDRRGERTSNYTK